jgi:hypothetical protein
LRVTSPLIRFHKLSILILISPHCQLLDSCTLVQRLSE